MGWIGRVLMVVDGCCVAEGCFLGVGWVAGVVV